MTYCDFVSYSAVEAMRNINTVYAKDFINDESPDIGSKSFSDINLNNLPRGHTPLKLMTIFRIIWLK